LKIFTLIFLELLFSSYSFGYGLSGLWKGTGTMAIKNGQVYNCSMILDIQHNSTSFLVKKTDFDCSVMHIKNKKANSLEIRDGQLRFNNLIYGFIDEKKMISDMSMVDGRKQYYSIDITSNHQLEYFDDIEWAKNGFRTQINGLLIYQGEDGHMIELK